MRIFEIISVVKFHQFWRNGTVYFKINLFWKWKKVHEGAASSASVKYYRAVTKQTSSERALERTITQVFQIKAGDASTQESRYKH